MGVVSKDRFPCIVAFRLVIGIVRSHHSNCCIGPAQLEISFSFESSVSNVVMFTVNV